MGRSKQPKLRENSQNEHKIGAENLDRIYASQDFSLTLSKPKTHVQLNKVVTGHRWSPDSLLMYRQNNQSIPRVFEAVYASL